MTKAGEKEFWPYSKFVGEFILSKVKEFLVFYNYKLYSLKNMFKIGCSGSD